MAARKKAARPELRDEDYIRPLSRGKAVVNPRDVLLEVGAYVKHEDGSIWLVERCSISSSTQRCVAGRLTGVSNTFAPQAYAYSAAQAPSEEEKALLRQEAAAVTAESRAEAKAARDAVKTERRMKIAPTVEQIFTVLNMRALKMTHAQIDEAMGLRGTRGHVSFKICKENEGELERIIREGVADPSSVPPPAADAPPPKVREPKQPATTEEIEKIRELRAAGKKWREVDEAMGWPEKRGNKSWGIAKKEGIA
jgi:hypothetical protein